MRSVDGGWLMWLQGLVASPVSLPSLSFSSLSLPLSMLCRYLGTKQLTGTIPSQLAELTGLTLL
jgi:hypothetical protein